MRDMVIAGVSPWVDYFEGLRRTRFANLHQRPRLVGQIVNDGGIGAFAQDAQLAWGHTIMYLVTGDEAYRKTPVEIINWYGSRTEESFFPGYFSDSHIKVGKYVYTLCSAADLLRYTTPRDQTLAVTGEMIDNLQTYCILPIRENSIQNNTYFMNQHSYAIMGYAASAIMADEVEGYQEVVEWTTVNTNTPNWGRSGSIKHQIRLVTRNAKTGEAVEPNEDGTFRPDRNMTRAEAASMLAGVVNDYSDRGAYECEYTDVSRSAWYYDDVAYMSQKGFITADDDKRFRPQEEITRAELAGFLALMKELRGGEGNRFSDIASKTLKRPDAPVTRADFVVAVNQMLQRNYEKDVVGAQPFRDVNKSHPAYFDIMGASHTHPIK